MRTWRPPEWLLGQERYLRSSIESGLAPRGAKIKDYRTGRMLEVRVRQTVDEFMDNKFRLELPEGGYLVLDKEELNYWFRYV